MAKSDNIFTDQSDEAKAARREMAHVNCDVEGMARDAELDRLCEKWIAEGIPHEEYLYRLKAAIKESKSSVGPE